MRSYHQHVQDLLLGKREETPILRSSALFPALQDATTSTRLLYMGYWMVKRRLESPRRRITIRNEHGAVIAQKEADQIAPKAYRHELSLLLGHSRPFVGSIEIEFFTKSDCRFPYPAVDLNFYGPQFSSWVHTAQRIYNDEADREKNGEHAVPESGFTIYADDQRTPFFWLINGREAKEDYPLYLTLIGADGQREERVERISSLPPYASQKIPLKDLPFQGVGTAKISFSLPDAFPRLLAGNETSSGYSLTHTYYDCQQAHAEEDYWSHPEGASLLVPLPITLTLYPIWSPGDLTLTVDIYSETGKKLSTSNHPVHNRQTLQQVPLQGPPRSCARVSVVPKGGSRLPARLKVALDSGNFLPCNICTNLQPYIPEWEQKKQTFRWAPFMADQPNPSLWIGSDRKAAELLLTFYREEDEATLRRELSLPAYGSVTIGRDPELESFLGRQVGWCTVQSSNPYTTLYSFAHHPSGIVGGDHGF